MTRDEVKEIIYVIGNEYKDFIPEKAERIKKKIDTWYHSLKNYEARFVQVKVIELLHKHTFGKPSIAHLMQYINPEMEKQNVGQEYADRFLELLKRLGADEMEKAIFQELQLEDYQLNRIDISINCKFEYEELYKLNLYFNSLDAVRCDAQNHYLVIGTDLDKRSIKFATKYYANEIYDKSIESQNRDNAKTRIEMRYKPRTNMDFETAVQETIATLGNLMGFYEKYNKLTIEHLQERYLKEKAELRDGKIGAFTEFVSRYYYMFTNMKILNGLYRLNMKGTCKSWLYKYRKGNRTLMLYPKSAISAYIAVLKKAVEHYCKM